MNEEKHKINTLKDIEWDIGLISEDEVKKYKTKKVLFGGSNTFLIFQRRTWKKNKIMVEDF